MTAQEEGRTQHSQNVPDMPGAKEGTQMPNIINLSHPHVPGNHAYCEQAIGPSASVLQHELHAPASPAWQEIRQNA